MLNGEELVFKYSALFQSIEVRLFSQPHEPNAVYCEAELRLPVLRKSFKTNSKFENHFLNWIEHSPIYESGAEERKVLKNLENNKAIDPIGFFLLLNSGQWESAQVQMLVGNRVIALDVTKMNEDYEIRRRDKDQKLIVKKNKNGISSLDVPIPLLGTISLKRV